TETFVRVDHATGAAALCRGVFTNDEARSLAPGKPLRSGDEIAVNPRDKFYVLVVHTNSAIYDYAAEQEPVPAPELATIQNAFAVLKPYLPDVLERGRIAAGSPSKGESAAVDAVLDEVRKAMFGAEGVEDTYVRTLQALERMKTDGVEPTAA